MDLWKGVNMGRSIWPVTLYPEDRYKYLVKVPHGNQATPKPLSELRGNFSTP